MRVHLGIPRKIVCIKLRALGDTVLMTAALNELHRDYPDAQIHLVVHAQWAPLFETHPGISKVWPYERYREATSRAKAIARLSLKLRKEKFDWAVNFHASPSSSTLAYATGARVRSIHYHGHKDKNRYSTVDVPGKGVLKPIIERDMDVIRALYLDVAAGQLPSIDLQSNEKSKAKENLTQLIPNVSSPLLGIGLGASRPTKAWPLERFAALAVRWVQDTGGAVLALSGPEETSLKQEFLKAVDDALVDIVKDFTLRTQLRSKITAENGLSLRSLAGIITTFDVFLGNDSGPRHLAVAVNVPTVTLFGPEHPFEWHPYPKDKHPYFFVEGLPCRKDAMPGYPEWCSLQVCVEQGHVCMKQLGIDAVLKACKDLIKS